MEEKEHGRSVGRDEVKQKVCNWVVVMSSEWKRRMQRMIPGLVSFGGKIVSRMENIAVDNIC